VQTTMQVRQVVGQKKGLRHRLQHVGFRVANGFFGVPNSQLKRGRRSIIDQLAEFDRANASTRTSAKKAQGSAFASDSER
jgi:hypothetical protein